MSIGVSRSESLWSFLVCEEALFVCNFVVLKVEASVCDSMLLISVEQKPFRAYHRGPQVPL